MFCEFILLTLSVAPVITKEVRNGVFPCSAVKSPDEFSCHDGSWCMDMGRVCDGIKQCVDASDEAGCPTINDYQQAADALSNTDSECGRGQMRCENGTCISSDDKCNCTLDCSEETTLPPWSPFNRSICVLPEYPADGTYKVLNVEDHKPGQAFPSAVLSISCRRGFGVRTTSGDTTKLDRHLVYCVAGRWFQSLPGCTRFCKLDEDPSISYLCHIEGIGFRPCNTYVPPGAIVKPVCKGPLYYSREDLRNMNCVAGFWDYVPQCIAECGRVTPEGKQLVIRGELAKRGELPWHAGIYSKNFEPYKQICGGSLVTNNVVLSAAHCFWHDVEKTLPASDYAVAVGKLYRPWNSEHDAFAQKSDVKRIIIPPRFKGEATNFQDDIAVVIVVTPFVYKTYVRPVCLNYDTNFESLQLSPGKFGKVAGWGLTDAQGQASRVLKVVELPFIHVGTCIDALPRSFTEYITSDKFCAGYLNGTNLCKGDSGGGLAFADKELGIYRYYLRGIVSTSPSTEEKKCNDRTYTAFTSILKHEGFIRRAIDVSVKKTCPTYMFQCDDGTCLELGADCNGILDCVDGSDEDEDLCNPDPDKSKPLPKPQCVLPPYPIHGAYRVMLNLDAEPGQIMQSVTLKVFCLRMVGVDARTTIYEKTITCTDGEWSGDMPNCLRNNQDILCKTSDGTIGECVPWDMCTSKTNKRVPGDTCGNIDEVCCDLLDQVYVQANNTVPDRIRFDPPGFKAEALDYNIDIRLGDGSRDQRVTLGGQSENAQNDDNELSR